MKFKPLHDRILVKRISAEQTTKSGLYIPDTAKEKPSEALVIAVGAGRVLKSGEVRPLIVKPGQKVLFAKYSGTEIKLDGEEHIVLREDDCVGVVED
jgi:chaperonin GroES